MFLNLVYFFLNEKKINSKQIGQVSLFGPLKH